MRRGGGGGVGCKLGGVEDILVRRESWRRGRAEVKLSRGGEINISLYAIGV